MRSFTFINLGLLPQVRTVIATLALSNCGSIDVEKLDQLGDDVGAMASANGMIYAKCPARCRSSLFPEQGAHSIS